MENKPQICYSRGENGVLELGKKKQADPWGSQPMTGPDSHLMPFTSQKPRWTAPEAWYSWLSCALHTNAHRCTCAQPHKWHTHTHTHVNIQKQEKHHIRGIFIHSNVSLKHWELEGWGEEDYLLIFQSWRKGQATKWCQSLWKSRTPCGNKIWGSNGFIHHVSGNGTGWTAAAQLARSTAATNSCRTRRLSCSLPIKARFSHCFS